jgi:FtsH-binding integral membrane protein
MYQNDLSTWDKLTTATTLAPSRAAVIRQTYLLLGVSVLSAMAGGYIGATSETVVRFFTSTIGWIAAIVLLNVIPMVAMAARHNPALGVAALVGDGFLAGLVISPLLYYATLVAPALIIVAFMITGLVFLSITGYVFMSGRVFNAPRGLMVGVFVAIMAAIVLNSFLHIGWLGVALSAGIGIMGCLSLVYSTSDVLNSPYADSPIPGALALFAGLFNVFVAVLNILLRLLGGGRRD